MGLFFAIVGEIPKNWLTLLTLSLRKSYKTYLFFIRYEKSEGLAIILDFTAHCAMKDEPMKIKSWGCTKVMEFCTQPSVTKGMILHS